MEDNSTGLRKDSIHAKPAGFVRDLLTVAGRALRAIPRELDYLIPALVIPVFFFVINVGALGPTSEMAFQMDFKAFQIPVAIIFAVTGISRAVALVNDIKSGYFDRLLISPISRMSLLLGLMVADFALVIALCLPVLLMAFIAGVHFETGVIGILAFLLISGLWGLVFTGFPYAIALRTGSPAAVNSSFLLFFPFAFLTTSFMPMDALSGWLATAAKYNPVTYLLEGLRSLIMVGWQWEEIGKALLAIAGVGAVSFSLALYALRGRVRRK